MIKLLKKFLENRRKIQFNKGYDFAAGALLREEETPSSITTLANLMLYDDFDEGMEKAVDDLIKLGIKDDRIKGSEDKRDKAYKAWWDPNFNK